MAAWSPGDPAATVTFADAAGEWLRYLEHERGRRKSTLRTYRLSLRNHIPPALGQLPLTAVTVARIDALRTYLIRHPPRPRTVDGQPAPPLKPEQAAELLAVGTRWIYEAVRTNRLPCLRIGRHIRLTGEMLEEWLRRRAEGLRGTSTAVNVTCSSARTL